MIPGEIQTKKDDIELNKGQTKTVIRVANTGDRPVQVGSHYHFFEINKNLRFLRNEALGMRLNLPAGTAVRFEPGEEKEVELVTISGSKEMYGLNGLVEGSVASQKERAIKQAAARGFKGATYS
ncbi:urease subunit beta [Salsuginibacillus kocurii]|uniref:urease subunit beta n=1 Tax=Salsuginibacillus kocurii TaxID=427078 RepID=UPI000360C1DA|nr:urease subunit beta [Salsuginibacillus kocurii]